MSANSQTSVVIAGAGPVGLGLACELGLRGVRCMLVEKRDGAITVPKQSMVSARNMEFCRRWGVAAAVRNAVWPQSYPRDFVYLDNLRGRELMRVKVPSYGQRDQRDFTPEAPCPCPQIYFDPILLARVKTFPNVTVRTHTALRIVSPGRCRRHGAAHRPRRPAPARDVDARYLVGCDGPAGSVRETLKIELGGLGVVAISVNIFFRSAALATFHDKGWARFYRLIDEHGCWSELIPIDGKELWRLTVFDEPASAAAPHEPAAQDGGGRVPLRDPLRVALGAPRFRGAELWAGPRHDRGRRRARVLADRRHRHAYRPRGGGESGLEARRHDGRLGRAGAGRLLRDRAIADRPAQRRIGDPLVPRHRRPSRAWPRWTRPAGAQPRTGCRSPSISRSNMATRARRSASRTARPRPIRSRRASCPPRVPARAPRMPGSRTDSSTLDLFGDGFTLLRLGDQPPDAGPLAQAASRAPRPAARDRASRIRRSRRSTKESWCWCARTAMSPGAAMRCRPTPPASWSACAAQPRAGPARGRSSALAVETQR